MIKESKKQNIRFLGEIPIIQKISEAGDKGDPLASKKKSDIYDIFKKISNELTISLSEKKDSKIKISN